MRGELEEKLTEHAQREQARSTAAFGKSPAYSAQLLQMQWRTHIVHARFFFACEAVRKRARARALIQSFVTVRCVRFLRRQKRRRQRAAAVRELEASLGDPPATLLEHADFHGNLPAWLSQCIAAAAKPRGVLSGEPVAIQGAPGTEIFVLVDGEIEATRQPFPASASPPTGQDGTKNKMAAPRVGDAEPLAVVAGVSTSDVPLSWDNGGRVFFEPLMFCFDRYEVTLTAKRDSRLYVISSTFLKDLVVDISKALAPASANGTSESQPPSVTLPALVPKSMEERRQAVRAAERLMDARRSAITEARCRLTDQFMRRASQVLLYWSAEGVEAVIALAACKIFRKGDIIVPPGQFGKLIVFVVSGRIEVVDSADSSRRDIVKDGQCIGDVAALLHLKQPTVSLRATTAVDVWVLKSADLRHLACHESAYAVAPVVLDHAVAMGDITLPAEAEQPTQGSWFPTSNGDRATNVQRRPAPSGKRATKRR
jgi:CRP-like cAMP-binding protein